MRGLLGRRASQTAPATDSQAPAGLDVDRLDEQVARLFAYVSDGLAAATAALVGNDRQVAKALVGTDQRIDCLYESVRETVEHELLAVPRRSEDQLRLLLMVAQAIPEIERSGDLVQHIAARAGQGVGHSLSTEALELIERMGAIGVEMWQAAAQAYADRDGKAGVRLRTRDDDLDDLHVRLTEELAATTEPMGVAVAIELGLVARFFERLGDHAVNVARRVESVVLVA